MSVSGRYVGSWSRRGRSRRGRRLGKVGRFVDRVCRRRESGRYTDQSRNSAGVVGISPKGTDIHDALPRALRRCCRKHMNEVRLCVTNRGLQHPSLPSGDEYTGGAPICGPTRLVASQRDKSQALVPVPKHTNKRMATLVRSKSAPR